MIPTDRRIRALHERYAPDRAAFELVHRHCEIVWAVAEQLLAARPAAVEAELVRAGCLLHDVGVHLLRGEPYIRHGILGYRLLRELGFPQRLCRFAAHHTGVGISRADIRRQALPLPPGDYLAETDTR